MKKSVFITIATLGLLTSGLATTAQTASATTYTRYTVSPKVRGSWKLKSAFYPIPEHKDPWTIYKRIKISAHSITLTRLTTKVDGTPIEKQMHKREGLSGGTTLLLQMI